MTLSVNRGIVGRAPYAYRMIRHRPPPEPGRPTLASRKRQVVRDELGEAALQLIARQGFDETTVEEIVAVAGVSRRTFFRYFASKEDVVVELLGDIGRELTDALLRRPTREPTLEALHHAMAEVMAHAATDHGAKPRRLTVLILRTPSLRARYLTRQDHWRGDLVAAASGRPDAALAAAAVGLALVAFEIALREWALPDDGDAVGGSAGTEPREPVSFAAALDRAFADVRQVCS